MADLPRRIELFLPSGNYDAEAKVFLWQEATDKWGLSKPVTSPCAAAEAARRLRHLADEIEADVRRRQGLPVAGEKREIAVDCTKRAGRFIRYEVILTDEPAVFDESMLDTSALKRLKKATKGKAYAARKAVATIAWESPAAREACISEQMEKGRWRRVLEYTKLLQEGQALPNRPVFVHPSLSGAAEGTLQEIDGTRRQLAHLEAGIRSLEVVVLVLKD